MKKVTLFLFVSLIALNLIAQTGKEKTFQTWANTPPIGWKSGDCFGPSVTEAEVKANADYVAENLKPFGWEYVVVDNRWYVDNQTTGIYKAYNNSTFIYDQYGRCTPSPIRLPSVSNGAGFKPLADYVHSKVLKFGIRIMSGRLRVGDNGTATFTATGLELGEHLFKAKCSGNAFYESRNADSLTIEVKSLTSSIQSNAIIGPYLYHQNKHSFLKGLKSGEQVAIDDCSGIQLECFSKQSDSCSIKYKGIAIVSVKTDRKMVLLKTI